MSSNPVTLGEADSQEDFDESQPRASSNLFDGGKLKQKAEKARSQSHETHEQYWSQSYDRELQRQRCKNLQRHE
jgi:hypothetical protein